MPSTPDRMINQEAAAKFHGERVILELNIKTDNTPMLAAT